MTDRTHTCPPDPSTYFCPAAGGTESACHGGFDTCCARPDLHQVLDPERRYLVPVGRLALPGEPDDVHLSLYRWMPAYETWATGMALCGRSAAQGPLPGPPEVTCAQCADLQPDYERYIAPGYDPAEDDPRALRTRIVAAEIQLRQAQRHAHTVDADRAETAARVHDLEAGLQRANARAARAHAEAVNAQAAVSAVRRLCHLTVSASVRVQAVEHAQDTLAVIGRVMADATMPGDEAWGTVWLHGQWRYLTSKMATAEREHAADAVARWSAGLAAIDGEEWEEPDGLRWWRPDAYLAGDSRP
ncbi:hypothetical protein [Streptomyces omiyaensis]|uniref:hypothetical protein n=1 Tax=Streptomyces omiyaensis TaxID=68247 RepID=UPI0036F78172